MLILLREGSAARDFDALQSLIGTDTDRVMLCSDDKHPDELLEGYIDRLVVRAIRNGQDVFDVLRVAAVNPVRHYGLPLGLLQPGDSFDAVQIDNVGNFRVDKVWLAGRMVVNDGICLLPRHPVDRPNAFNAEPVHAPQLSIPHPGSPCRVIVASDGQVVTRQTCCPVPEKDGCIAADPDSDVLFLAVVNRYRPAPPALALVQGFGITGSDGRGGAIASSVAHDSHNVVAVGTSAEWLALAINAVIHECGGLAAVDADGKRILPLPIAGLMSDGPVEEVALAYRRMNLKARAMGSRLSAPFMTLSFMSLLVIPELKLSDRGLFDGMRFEFCDLRAGDGEVPA
jgi:adenine deaminase